MGEFINQNVIPVIMKFVNSKPIMALRDGLVATMALTIVGSLFLLIANFPINAVTEFMKESGAALYLNQAYESTFNIISIAAATCIGYAYVKNEGFEGIGAGIISMSVFFIIQKHQVIDPNNPENIISGVINKEWTAGKGMVGAIIVGLLVGFCYATCMKKNIRIKLPEMVPEGVANSFNAIIPGFFAITAATVIFTILDKLGTDLLNLIYTILQTPLETGINSVPGMLLMAIFGPFLWWFGIHGSTIVGGVLGPLLQANYLHNQALVDKGVELTVANGGRIVTQQFLDQFITVTGAGITIGLLVYMTFFAKSEQFKNLGKLSLVPGLFNINEPILFATPIVMNPFMAIPFILTPVLSACIQYFAIYTGLTPMYTAITVPWTTPPIISGFLIGGIRTMLLQAFILVLTFFTYLPFARKLDKINYKEEQGLSQKEITEEMKEEE
ncbi:MAG: PTS transporter subunit EIIC [Tissierellia bacterium]|nr:PTS transporter subunit EIIC [Tissierellia bacterium]